MAELIDVPDDLGDVAVAETEIGDVVGDRGYYHYRGVSAPDLARSSDFETAAGLILGQNRPLQSDRTLPTVLEDVIGSIDLRAALSMLGSALELQPLLELDAAQQLEGAQRLVSVFPTLIASVLHGRPVEPDPALGHVADYLRMVLAHEAPPEIVSAMEAFFVLTIDHGFNNSTFATRVVASAGADLGACVLAGFCSLSAPRHGANMEGVLDMYDAIATPANAADWMKAEIADRRRIQGFGHAVYRREDPRLTLLREHGAVLAPERHLMATAVEAAGASMFGGRGLAPNLDLHAPVVLEASGIPRGWFQATFAAARMVGWCAHAMEQGAKPKIIRPAARYVGPPPTEDLY